MIIIDPIVSELSDGYFKVDFLYDGHAISTASLPKRLGVEEVKKEMVAAVQAYVDVRADDNYGKIIETLRGEVELPDPKRSSAAVSAPPNEEPLEG